MTTPRIEKTGYWVVQTSGGILYTDMEGRRWRSGNKKVGVALFKNRHFATTFAKKALKEKPALYRWTKTVHCFLYGDSK